MQLDALVNGPLLAEVCRGQTGTLRIVVLGCSFGPEPVSIASMFLRHQPGLDFRIDGYDIDEDSLSVARQARYDRERHVYSHYSVDNVFVAKTFVEEDGKFRVRDEILSHIEYHYGDASDPGLRRLVGESDVVFAQHFLYHLERPDARMAFRSIASLVRPGGALFVDGMDLDLREREAPKLGLRPFEYQIEEIHEASRRTQWAAEWPYQYWGLEPFLPKSARDWKTRYATIFVRARAE